MVTFSLFKISAWAIPNLEYFLVSTVLLVYYESRFKR
jgi:hypothetical protein